MSVPTPVERVDEVIGVVNEIEWDGPFPGTCRWCDAAQTYQHRPGCPQHHIKQQLLELRASLAQPREPRRLSLVG